MSPFDSVHHQLIGGRSLLHWRTGTGVAAAALTDPAAFDLAALDTAIWNDVLDAASMASDFAF